ncbi:AraC family transcriptional regulator [Acaryochloris sp. 'Moss Beach']|uniref:helix-turn-helix domain-containing protein n=1 Tax=Acaryochloris sp. 'Moss Beach' TaxID=2740837 RepID=UPI001F168100|nr:helix-turn-helix domain-containing protein [Acaryochloris sp. 'Moss Beach']UJB69950.1 AraC family transcriptional regulator [Acaryochloris sp. 'Moss Beach']
MTDCILDIWQHTATTSGSALIIPDGCRDIILSTSLGERPAWRITPLDTQTRNVYTREGVSLMGVRLQPGTQINEQQLLSNLSADINEQDLKDRINRFCSLSRAVAESLECLRSQPRTVATAAKWLGITPRTLQRLMVSQTGQPPSFWLQLARVRQTALALKTSMSLVDIAHAHGYADQAHMSRAIKHWLGVSPTNLAPEQFDRLMDLGYG